MSSRRRKSGGDHEDLPYVPMHSKKLYRSKRVYWYRWTGSSILNTPPPVPANMPSIPDRALFVYYRQGHKEPQIWQRKTTGAEPSWKEIQLGENQVINGNTYVLTLNMFGDPSWLTISTAERKAQKARRMQIKQESHISQSSSIDL